MISPVVPSSAYLVLGILLLIVFALVCSGLIVGLVKLRRGRKSGFVIIAVTLAIAFGPIGVQEWRIWRASVDIAARQILPDTLDFTGQRVLFLNTSNAYCYDLCEVVLEIGTGLEAYGAYLRGDDDLDLEDPDAFTALLGPPSDVRRVGLRQPSNLDRPPFAGRLDDAEVRTRGFDAVVITDRRGWIADYAPELLGPPLPGILDPRHVTLVFTDWPDPFTTPPPPPTYRSVEGWLSDRLPFPWMIWRRREVPFAAGTADPQWYAALCPSAGAPGARAERTHATMCGIKLAR